MSKFKLKYGDSSKIDTSPITAGVLYLATDTGKLYIDMDKDGSVERFLINKSSIFSKITNEWNSDISLIAEKNVIYVYTDRIVKEDGTTLPGVKIGDGSSFLIDMPFLDEAMWNHVNNSSIHITDKERVFWNNKITCYLDSENAENIIFDKN